MKYCRFLLCLWIMCICASGAEPVVPLDTNRFHPVSLEKFYQRLLVSYRPRDAWGAVPRGVVEFDGVPFRMFGKIEMNGLGPTRDRNFLPTRVGEIPVKKIVGRLHLISGAGYKDPDGTPLAEVRLHYTNGEVRNIFINYGDHVRNWHVESDEKRTDLTHPNSHIIWEGINGATGRPIRLFKNTFDNPMPKVEVRSIELLSLFGRAFPAFCAITLEKVEGLPARADAEEPDDTELRREILLRVLDDATGKAVSNAMVIVRVSDGENTYPFGRFRTDLHGQVLLDYPPGKFESLSTEISAAGFVSQAVTNSEAGGIFPAGSTIRLK